MEALDLKELSDERVSHMGQDSESCTKWGTEANAKSCKIAIDAVVLGVL